MDFARGFVVEHRPGGLQKSSGTRVMGEKLGPENGMDRTSVHGPVSLGPQSIARISFGHDSHVDGCPGADNKPTFWKVDGDYMELSVTCNWRFVNLNDKFRPSAEFPSTRPLHMYCDVGTRSMVGNRITDLLREIKYHPQNTTHFEPRHIQYVPVRNEVVEIVETQMAETNGDLVQFGEGHTILTLHFKREVVV